MRPDVAASHHGVLGLFRLQLCGKLGEMAWLTRPFVSTRPNFEFELQNSNKSQYVYFFPCLLETLLCIISLILSRLRAKAFILLVQNLQICILHDCRAAIGNLRRIWGLAKDISVALGIFINDCGTRDPDIGVYVWVHQDGRLTRSSLALAALMKSLQHKNLWWCFGVNEKHSFLIVWLSKSAVAITLDNGKSVVDTFWSNGVLIQVRFRTPVI